MGKQCSRVETPEEMETDRRMDAFIEKECIPASSDLSTALGSSLIGFRDKANRLIPFQFLSKAPIVPKA
jgi:hypothetical protein